MYNQSFWAGSDTTYQVVANAYKQVEARLGTDTPSDMPGIYSKEGSVAVIKISGSLIPGAAGWMSYYGVVGYDDIRAALVEAVMDEGVTSILLDLASGGGAVTGMSDTADFLAKVAKIKPVTAFVECAASAAYRLAIEASSIIVSDSGVTGSIGVLRIHTEYSKQMAENGVTATVIRSGEFKALLNPIEALTPEALAQEQGKLDYLGNLFEQAVQSRREISAEDMKNTAGQGREFLGQMGVKAGLADKVGNYESALKAAEKSVEKPATTPKVKASVAQMLAQADTNPQNAGNTEGSNMSKPTFTAEALAAIAAGAVLPEAEALEGAAALESMQADLTTAQAATATATAANIELTTELATATAALATAEASLVTSTAVSNLMRNIVEASLDNMSVALGGSKGAFASVPAEGIVAEHAKMSASFATKFKVGGVTATATGNEDQAAKAEAPDPMFVARLKASSTAK